MFKYLVFAGDTFYASGGINDLSGGFDTLQEAEGHADLRVSESYADWYQIVEHATMKVVKKYGAPYGSSDYEND